MLIIGLNKLLNVLSVFYYIKVLILNVNESFKISFFLSWIILIMSLVL